VAHSKYIKFVYWENIKKINEYTTKAEKFPVDIKDEVSQRFPPKQLLHFFKHPFRLYESSKNYVKAET
jgi:hypothetical protein